MNKALNEPFPCPSYMPTTILFICLFLLGISAIQNYFRDSVIPAVCWTLIAGVFYGIVDANTGVELPHIVLDPEVVLFILLPVLIFDSARSLSISVLKKVFLHALYYATIGVLVVMASIAFPFALITGIPPWDAIFFGAIMAATDPVAVAAIFKNFKFPKRLHVLVEGESLLNDGTAIILFVVLSSFIVDKQSVSTQGVFAKFLIAIFGAFVLGLLVGIIAVWVMKSWHAIHDKFIGAVIPLVSVYSSFVIGEHFFHVSGVLAVMTCTLTMTSFHSKIAHRCKEQSDADHHFDQFWSLLGDLANQILFFILGAAIGAHLIDVPWKIAPLLVGILFVSRIVGVYSGGVVFKLIRVSIPVSWLNVLNIAGLKGALSVALILLLPAEYRFRHLFLCAAFVMISFSLIANSIAMRWYLNQANLADGPE